MTISFGFIIFLIFFNFWCKKFHFQNFNLKIIFQNSSFNLIFQNSHLKKIIIFKTLTSHTLIIFKIIIIFLNSIFN